MLEEKSLANSLAILINSEKTLLHARIIKSYSI